MKMSSTLIRLVMVFAAVVVIVVVSGPGTVQASGHTPVIVNGDASSLDAVSACTLPATLTGAVRNVTNWLNKSSQKIARTQPFAILKAQQFAARLSNSLKSMFNSKQANKTTNVKAGTVKTGTANATSNQISQPVAMALGNAMNILSALLQCAR